MNQPNRLHSLDALRGFDMFWIMGGDFIIHALAKATGLSFFILLSQQMEHVEWNGFVFYDMIFPLFLFIAGVSMPFSLSKRMERGDTKKALYITIIRRTLILIFFGCIYNGLLRFNWETMRYASVLARIGLAWGFASIIFMNTKLRGQIIWCLSILVGYWAAMMLIPVPGYGAGVLTVDGSLAGYIDRLLVPGRLYLEVHDPEGIVSLFPAISTALLGVIAGHILRSSHEKLTKTKKAGLLAVIGISLVIVGNIWGLFFPVNKNLWTSSFVFVAGGWSYILLALFYFVIDVLSFKKWAFPFTVIGLNSITIYMCWGGLINFRSTSQYLFSGLIKLFAEPAQHVLTGIGATFIAWLFLYFLYKKKIFLKI